MKNPLLTVSILALTIAAQAQTVVTVAGTGINGDVIGPVATAQFAQPRGIITDGSGNIYLTDLGNQKIKKIAAGNVTTISGTGSVGGNDGPIATATFSNPAGMCFDANGNIYVVESGGHRVRFVDLANGAVSLVAGTGSPGNVDGSGSGASFNVPTDIDIDNNGNLFVADYNNNAVRVITAGSVNTLANGILAPHGLAVNPAGSVLYVGSRTGHVLLRITPTGVDTLAGNGIAANVDGVGSAASFTTIMDLDLDANGNIYAVTDDGELRKITPAGVVTTLVGSANIYSYLDGNADSVKFLYSTGLSVVDSAHIYVTELNGAKVKEYIGAVAAGTNTAQFISPTITLFPNPTSGNFKLVADQTFDNAVVVITDVVGKEISRTSIVNSASIDLQIEDAPGIYFVMIETRSGKIVERVVKR